MFAIRRWGLLAALLASGCSSSPTGPSPRPFVVVVSGTVTATNGGQPLSGATIDVGTYTTVTNATGAFSLEMPQATRFTLAISGADLVKHTVSVSSGTPLALDAISQSGGFDLAFYRQFVRNGFDAPSSLRTLTRWTTDPSFDLQIADDQGVAMDPALVANVRAAIAAVVPIWTDGRFVARFESGGVPVKWLTTTGGICGRSTVGLSAGSEIDLYYKVSGCTPTYLLRTVKHETGHLMGFYHTDNPGDLMFAGGAGTEPSARERFHAAIAYKRPIGNRDLDDD